MTNVPERKEGSTSVASGVDRLRGLKLVTRADGNVKHRLFRIELHEDLISACRGVRRADPLTASLEGINGQPNSVSAVAERNPISKIAAFAVAGLLIGYFLGKHR